MPRLSIVRDDDDDEPDEPAQPPPATMESRLAARGWTKDALVWLGYRHRLIGASHAQGKVTDVELAAIVVALLNRADEG